MPGRTARRRSAGAARIEGESPHMFTSTRSTSVRRPLTALATASALALALAATLLPVAPASARDGARAAAGWAQVGTSEAQAAYQANFAAISRYLSSAPVTAAMDAVAAAGPGKGVDDAKKLANWLTDPANRAAAGLDTSLPLRVVVVRGKDTVASANGAAAAARLAPGGAITKPNVPCWCVTFTVYVDGLGLVAVMGPCCGPERYPN